MAGWPLKGSTWEGWGAAELHKPSWDSGAPVFNINATQRAVALAQVNDLGGGDRRQAEECGVKNEARPVHKAVLLSVRCARQPLSRPDFTPGADTFP